MKKAGKFVAVILMSLVAGIILGLAILPSGIGGGLCAGYLFEAFTRATTWMDSALSLVRSTMWGAIAYGYWQWIGKLAFEAFSETEVSLWRWYRA